MRQPAVLCRLHKEHLPHSQKDSAPPVSLLKSAAEYGGSEADSSARRGA